jgi:hypothetical protein
VKHVWVAASETGMVASLLSPSSLIRKAESVVGVDSDDGRWQLEWTHFFAAHCTVVHVLHLCEAFPREDQRPDS